MTCLIIVCCHAVFHGTDPLNAAHWSLAPFQQATPTKPAEHHTFIAHIHAALAALRHELTSSPRVPEFGVQQGALVVLSGGCTNAKHVSISEAGGYLRAATILTAAPADNTARAPLAGDAANDDSELLDRVYTEVYATDLYQNILFALLRYHAIRHSWPERIKVVTHAFKAQRVRMHAAAIRWTKPLDVLGIDPPFDEAEAAAVAELERRNARDCFAADPYGSRAPLRDKRLVRLWQDKHVDVLAEKQSPSVIALLRWTGGASGSELFPGELPWNFESPPSSTVDTV